MCEAGEYHRFGLLRVCIDPEDKKRELCELHKVLSTPGLDGFRTYDPKMGDTTILGNPWAQTWNAEMIVDRTSAHVCQLIILIVLSKETAQYMQIRMSHEPLQYEDIHSAA